MNIFFQFLRTLLMWAQVHPRILINSLPMSTFSLFFERFKFVFHRMKSTLYWCVGRRQKVGIALENSALVLFFHCSKYSSLAFGNAYHLTDWWMNFRYSNPYMYIQISFSYWAFSRRTKRKHLKQFNILNNYRNAWISKAYLLKSGSTNNFYFIPIASHLQFTVQYHFYDKRIFMIFNEES